MSNHRSILEGYLTSGPSQLMDHSAKFAEYFDKGLGLGQHVTGLGREIALLRGDGDSAKRFDSVSGAFGMAGGTLCAGRLIFPLESLLSGKMFWERNNDGNWVRDVNGGFKRRGFISITMEILSLGARILSPINWLHGMGVYDLGKHSKRMSDATLGIWGAVITLDIVENVCAMKDDSADSSGYSERTKKRIADTVCDLLDLAALPFDFGYGMTSTPELAIVGATLNIIAKGGYLIKEALYYDSFNS
ncbi:MAG: hypothetical protein JJU12_01065 [Chlamydiales bacterium]|nr:hypothetical protein [Chlamydiales bacterium]